MRLTDVNRLIPTFLLQWFKQKNWIMHSFQQKMFVVFAKNQSTLLVAPTGGGKTLASFLPALVDIHLNQPQGLHTLYISPLKALTQDIHRNLLLPIKEMTLAVEVAIRTGDTSSYQRQKQLKKPPNILLTTPESLMLLLSYTNAQTFFSKIKLIIIDEIHSLATNKRGDFTSLALAQLHQFSPQAMRIGLSATVANPQKLASWLVPVGSKVDILNIKSHHKPSVHLLSTCTMPYSGFKARYAISSIYELLLKHKLTIVFVNTRAQAEYLFHQLWMCNEANLAIAIYHGSLSKEQRLKTEALIVEGKIKAIIATSALELGIDWGDIDAIIQVGAPQSISRLIQRIGRSNHQFNKASLAYIVPTNYFDALESIAAINAVAKGKLDDEEMHLGALDIVVQFIINSACSQPIQKTSLFKTIRSAYPYRYLKKAIFLKLFQFAVDGGYTLQHYPQYHRLTKENYKYVPSSSKVIRRHRQNIGTIIEAARLRVKVINKRKDRYVGDIEESFIQELKAGDSFLFAGEVLEYVRIHDMHVETRKTKALEPKLPSYRGGIMPLSTFLADEVLKLINQPQSWTKLPPKIREWLKLQQKFSLIPNDKAVLVEQFTYKQRNYLVIYSFVGRRANHSLGILLTQRLEVLKLKPINFTVIDYGLAISTVNPIESQTIAELFTSKILYEELEIWLSKSSLLKRTFRQIAIISGLTERQIASTHKSMKQVTFSTDLIYDVLQRYEPEHILLKITREEVDKLLVDIERLTNLLKRFHHNIHINLLSRPSPFAIPILSTYVTEKLNGTAEEEVLSSAEIEAMAVKLINEVKKIVN
ncbi:helicase, DEAD/DEAH box family [Legionella beliardensis]|uniref:Helicase, DEAD/DEAH box family n=1 Tax=Legionella beliardensis TaxID=91822 RepID=A0A378I3S5_9GAMM|nr:ligase-associated DNA damage response DEXH box helicase [Legionella beliardensis]STX29829.1 helicase, DEAD/DEAH box family [Legionella beliardensis]